MSWFDQILKQLISFAIFLPFIPLFVAFNALGILPIFPSLTTEISESDRKGVTRQSHRIMQLMKEGGAKGIGKVYSLLLAAFAMMMIRMGIKGWMDLFNPSKF